MSSEGQPEYDPLAPWNKEYHDAHLRIASALDRIADTLERLLKSAEMSP